MTTLIKHAKSYAFPLLLVLSIVLGGLTGQWLGPQAANLKPLGQILLNLIFTIIVPLVFFSVASAVAKIAGPKVLGKMLASMLVVFVLTSAVAAIFMISVVKLFPTHQALLMPFHPNYHGSFLNTANNLVSIFTVSDFSKLLLPNNMLALIVFAILIGLSTSLLGNEASTFARFLITGSHVCMKAISLIMFYAPIGFFAYFAAMVGQLGPQLMRDYLDVTLIYYSAALLYFFLAYTFYAYLAAGLTGMKRFWTNLLLPVTTSLATCSSAASIPANLSAAEQIGVPESIAETTIPIGNILHKDGTVLGAIIKISFLFGLFHMSFASPLILLTAIAVAILVGSVMGAIPSGGMLGEMLILSLYGFPPQALIMIAAISVIIDPLATMLNVTGNTVCSMLVARLMIGKNWLNP